MKPANYAPVAADREAQAQMVARLEDATALTYDERQVVFGLGRLLVHGQTLNGAQEGRLQKICAAHGVALGDGGKQ
jgi:hypothetical protein